MSEVNPQLCCVLPVGYQRTEYGRKVFDSAILRDAHSTLPQVFPGQTPETTRPDKISVTVKNHVSLYAEFLETPDEEKRTDVFLAALEAFKKVFVKKSERMDEKKEQALCSETANLEGRRMSYLTLDVLGALREGKGVKELLEMGVQDSTVFLNFVPRIDALVLESFGALTKEFMATFFKTWHDVCRLSPPVSLFEKHSAWERQARATGIPNPNAVFCPEFLVPTYEIGAANLGEIIYQPWEQKFVPQLLPFARFDPYQLALLSVDALVLFKLGFTSREIKQFDFGLEDWIKLGMTRELLNSFQITRGLALQWRWDSVLLDRLGL